MRYCLLFLISLMLMTSCNQQQSGENVANNHQVQAVPEWSLGIVWYQVFPERFRNGDPNNDPELADQEGCWPHELSEPWEVHSWSSDWYSMQEYEKKIGKDIGYNLTRRRYGGDIQGIIDKLDYLKDLGVEALYLNPVFMAPSSHKYDIASYHHIDPNFGPDPSGDRMIIAGEIPDEPASWQWTSADKLALKLIEEVHKRGMRIIFDGVFNHVGYNHFAITDLRENQKDSRFRDWFTVYSWDDPEAGTSFNYQGWWGIKDMPELREDEHGIVNGPKQYIFDIAERWMNPYGQGELSKGIDGWRLDVAYEVGHPFWKEWRLHVKSINPDAYLVAEVIDTPEKLKSYLSGDEFDAVMNYNFDFICSEFFINKDILPTAFDSRLQELREAFKPEVSLAMQNLLGSHDTDRPSSRIKNKGIASFLAWEDYFGIGKSGNPDYMTDKPGAENYAVLKMMAAFQMTYPGSPMIYYGDEVGMWGAGDPDCRKPMLWEDVVYENEQLDPWGNEYDSPHEVKPDIELFEYYRQLIKIRKQHPAIRYGDYKPVAIDNSKGIYAFMRKYEEDVVIAVFNNSDDLLEIILSDVPEGKFANELNGMVYISESGSLKVELQAHEAGILTWMN